MRCIGPIARSVVAIGVVLAFAGKVSAGGIELTGAGAQATGRGGAVTARADDPMVLMYNPAGLAELQGNNLLLDNSLIMMNACVDPIGYYGWGTFGFASPARLVASNGQTLDVPLGSNDPTAVAYASDPYDTVCMKNRPLAVPQLGATFRLTDRLGIGLGLMFPQAQPMGQWGDSNGMIQGRNGLRPAATRYMLINAGTLGIFPTIGFGFRITDFFRVGASFEWGMINVDNTNAAVSFGGNSPGQDIIGRIQGTDWFVPAVTASAHIVPFDSLDIVGTFRWQDALHASGTIGLNTNVFEPAGRPNVSTMLVDDIEFNFPYKLRVGIRYSQRLAPRQKIGDGLSKMQFTSGERIHDPMQDERWDIEADVEYLMSDNNQQQVIKFAPNQKVTFARIDGGVTEAAFPQLNRPGGTTDTIINKRFQNQISVSVGGTYNILPGLFAMSLGGHYETRGVDPAFMQIDYWPLSRVGLHAGVKFRIGRTIDLTFSYAHIFQETLVVGAPDHKVGTDLAKDFVASGVVTGIDKRVGVAATRNDVIEQLPEQPPSRMPDATAALTQNATQTSSSRAPLIINSGTYRSSFDVISVGAQVHF
jgi:hypothetical protein